MRSQGFVERVESSVAYEPMSGCWLWMGHISDSGHGRAALGRKSVYVHRQYFHEKVCPVPDGLFVLHKCDTPCCVNLDHLYVGTKKDNALDRERRGRGGGPKRSGAAHPSKRTPGWSSGTRNGRSKLTESNVREVRALHAQGVSMSDLARKYEVTKTNISHICNFKLWKNVK